MTICHSIREIPRFFFHCVNTMAKNVTVGKFYSNGILRRNCVVFSTCKMALFKLNLIFYTYKMIKWSDSFGSIWEKVCSSDRSNWSSKQICLFTLIPKTFQKVTRTIYWFTPNKQNGFVCAYLPKSQRREKKKRLKQTSNSFKCSTQRTSQLLCF